ncbi:hypothetical protein L6452_27838 [Arctium lappa]|uniref:Uncharacterized protein n=1 Tax=Arctium lappa TaxID=4217 RepID=A0ACB8ZWP1_ARCLA|nr:hypothetical protein L6452_27838 [Arctium lappa]
MESPPKGNVHEASKSSGLSPHTTVPSRVSVDNEAMHVDVTARFIDEGPSRQQETRKSVFERLSGENKDQSNLCSTKRRETVDNDGFTRVERKQWRKKEKQPKGPIAVQASQNIGVAATSHNIQMVDDLGSNLVMNEDNQQVKTVTGECRDKEKNDKMPCMENQKDCSKLDNCDKEGENVRTTTPTPLFAAVLSSFKPRQGIPLDQQNSNRFTALACDESSGDDVDHTLMEHREDSSAKEVLTEISGEWLPLWLKCLPSLSSALLPTLNDLRLKPHGKAALPTRVWPSWVEQRAGDLDHMVRRRVVSCEVWHASGTRKGLKAMQLLTGQLRYTKSHIGHTTSP